MSHLGSHRSRLALGAGALAVAGSGLGFALTASPAVAAPKSHPVVGVHQAIRLHRAALLARTDFASIELKVDGHWVTYDFDRGTVASVSPTAITIDRPDGVDVTLSISSTTKFRGVSAAGAVVTGKGAAVISEDGAALRITQQAPRSTVAGSPQTRQDAPPIARLSVIAATGPIGVG